MFIHRTELHKEMKDALKVINDSLLKKLGSKPFASFSLKTSKATIGEHWFRISSTGTSNPHEVEDYLDYFESLSVPLLEYCVNLSDSNVSSLKEKSVRIIRYISCRLKLLKLHLERT